MTGLIAALDTTDLARARRWADAVAPHCGMVKLGLEFFMANGAEGVRAIDQRPVFLDLGGRTDLLEAARAWEGRVDIHTARTDDRSADALLIRPDAHIAWAAAAGERVDTAAPALREALSCWFGTPQ